MSPILQQLHQRLIDRIQAGRADAAGQLARVLCHATRAERNAEHRREQELATANRGGRITI